MPDLALLASFASRPEAVVTLSLLRAHGVEAHMPEFNALMADFDPSFMASGWRVMVHADKLEAARAILSEAQARAGDGADGASQSD